MPDKTQQADIHYRRGVVLEQSGRIAEAVEEYRQALQSNPRLRAAHVALAKYYERNGLLAKACDAWAAVVAIEVDYEALSRLAAALIELKRYEDARAILRSCLQYFPQDPFIQYELGYIDYAEGNHRGALDQLIELRPIYNDEWQLHDLIGNCQLRLGLYDAALASFGRAILLCNDDEQLDELQESVAVVQRHHEFSSIESIKDRFYADHAMVCLGSAGDDGLNIAPAAEFAWSYEAIALTLRRLLALAAGGVWRCNAVVAFDRQAEPVARVIAAALGQPLREPGALGERDLALVVMATLDNAAALDAIHDRLPGPIVVFVLSLHVQPRAGDTVPHIIGLPLPVSALPWEARLRAEPATRAAVIEEARGELATALAQTPPEANQDAQVAYYATDHRRLDFPTPPLQPIQ